MSITVVIITLIVVIIFADVIAIMPSAVVRIFSYIGNMNTKTLALFLIIIAVILIAIKKIRKK